MGERWSRPGHLRADEVEDGLTPGEQAQVMAAARELESLAAATDIAPGAGFSDRVMAAVAAEPTPRPMKAAASAARRGAVLGVLAAFGDLWRVAWTGGRPLAARAPAMAPRDRGPRGYARRRSPGRGCAERAREPARSVSRAVAGCESQPGRAVAGALAGAER